MDSLLRSKFYEGVICWPLHFYIFSWVKSFSPSFLSHPPVVFSLLFLKQKLFPPLHLLFYISITPYLTVLFPSEHSSCIPLRTILQIADSLLVAGNFLSWCVPRPLSLLSPIRNTMHLDTSFKSERGNVQVCMNPLQGPFWMHTWLIFILYSAPLSLRVALSYVTLSSIMRKLWQPQIDYYCRSNFMKIHSSIAKLHHVSGQVINDHVQ